MGKIMGGAHIGLYVKDVEKTKEFYSDLLGFSVISEIALGTTKIAFLQLGGYMIEAVQVPADAPIPDSGRFDHLAFQVDNLDEEIARFEAAGVKFETDIIQNEEFWDKGMKYIFFRGPDNERLEILEIL